jgi:hypothetical protein
MRVRPHRQGLGRRTCAALFTGPPDRTRDPIGSSRVNYRRLQASCSAEQVSVACGKGPRSAAQWQSAVRPGSRSPSHGELNCGWCGISDLGLPALKKSNPLEASTGRIRHEQRLRRPMIVSLAWVQGMFLTRPRFVFARVSYVLSAPGEQRGLACDPRFPFYPSVATGHRLI